MPSSKPPPTPASAPDLIGPTSVLGGQITGPRAARRRRDRPYAHAQLEIDFASEAVGTTDAKRLVGKIEGLFGERQVKEAPELASLSAAALHAFAARGFRWVDDWKASPGGGPAVGGSGPSNRSGRTPIGELLKALESGAWEPKAPTKSFEVWLSDLGGNHADLTIRKVHRRRQHGATLDLRGRWTQAAVEDLSGSLRNRLPVKRITLTKFQYA